MNYEAQGVVIQLLPEQTGTGKNGQWIKKDFVIETKDQYPKKISFSAWGDKAEQVKTINVGQTVNVAFNIESREFNGKRYTDLRIWKLDLAEAGSAPAAPLNNITEADFQAASSNSELDELPF